MENKLIANPSISFFKVILNYFELSQIILIYYELFLLLN